MTSDPHTLDEYFAAVASRESVTIWDVKRSIWGDATGRDATVLALRELEAQGRIVRKDCKYRVAGTTTPAPSDPADSDPTVARFEVTETKPGTIEHVELACTVDAAGHSPFVSAVNRAAGAVVDTMFGVSEYPDAIIAEAEVFAKRAAKALEVARAELARAEAAEHAAADAHCAAAAATLAALQRVERLERIAHGVE